MKFDSRHGGFLLLLWSHWSLAANSGNAYLDMSIEELMDVEVYSASKYPQKASEAPAAVTVLTAEDIRAFGWRTLAEALRSLRGVYTSYDRNYVAVGSRGFSPPGDYTSRILLLLDGYRLNETIYDSAMTGNDFILDVDLIDRIEYVPGPGSAIYGTHAFFGVVNVITKKGRAVDGAQLAGEYRSFDGRKGRATYGKQYANGLDVLLSATRLEQRGQDLYFPEYNTPAQNHGVADGLDQEQASNLFAKIGYRSLTWETAYGDHPKQTPTAIYGQAFNDPHSRYDDRQFFSQLGYADAFPDSKLDVAARVFYGRYGFTGVYAYDPPPRTLNRDDAVGEWWGGELRFLGNWFDRHKLVFGTEYQNNARQNQQNFDESPYRVYLNNHYSGYRYGVYVQDDFALTDKLTLNAGARFDMNDQIAGRFSPRAGLIYRPAPETTLKALYGQAFRSANVYERFYQQSESVQKANPNLDPEAIDTYELVLEQRWSQQARFVLTGYHYELDGLIVLQADPADGVLQTQNAGPLRANGIETEGEYRWNNGTRLRSSYSWQSTQGETGARLPNSPEHLAKLNLAVPLWRDRLLAGFEWQYVGNRKNSRGVGIGDHWFGNLTLIATHPQLPGLELSGSVYNLFDQRYGDPSSDEFIQQQIPQDGRAFRVKLSYRF